MDAAVALGTGGCASPLDSTMENHANNHHADHCRHVLSPGETGVGHDLAPSTGAEGVAEDGL